MRLIGLIPSRNEAWCLAATVRAALMWCDALVVLEHATTDDSPAIISAVQAEYPDRVRRMTEADPAWNEVDYRNRLLGAGRDWGGTHFASIDSDEILTGNLLGKPIRDAAESLKPGGCLWMPWLCLWRSLDRWRNDDTTFGQCRSPVIFRDDGMMSHKPKIADYAIHARVPAGTELIRWGEREDGGLLHLQHVEWRRLLAKHALYKMTEVIRWPWRGRADVERLYNLSSEETGARLLPVPAEWWAPYADLRKLIRLGEEPWHEKVARDLAEKHPGRFGGLSLFGVV